MESVCFGCGQNNPAGQTFCGACGEPLALSAFVGKQVDTRLSQATRERELVETESAVRIFEKVYGWAKIVSGVAASLIAILAVGATWRFLDLRSAVNNAETVVTQASKSASTDIRAKADTATADSARAVDAVQTASLKAIQSSKQAESMANSQRASMVRVANSARLEIRSDAESFAKDFASAHQQLNAVKELEPQVKEVQERLASAQAQIQEQQRVIVSSEEFAKRIILSQRHSILDVPNDKANRHVVIPGSPAGTKPRIWLYMLLPEAPISQGMRLQFHQTVAAAGSFVSFHNIVILAIQADAQAELLGQDISAEYFVEPSDHVIIKKLEAKEGRVFADGQALPKFGEASDTGFTPNALYPFLYGTQPGAPTTSVPQK